ncbi:oxidoreductase-like domain-containing protein [Pseudoduganella aquatica]|uniref:Oxidoreductase-like protein n=1 Tax=Pseudoduganella aquatica TaxID=2660641 RepID=A0A7X4HE48_9BURK|nr:oxidoreductase-like domain-containing protein [Pseudoduganella aquatica]MYN09591.1 oxidoreductase-like protein [Pseudoduganella aquatica]
MNEMTETTLDAEDPRPEPPQPPEPGDCCHSGCAYCVDDMYQDALDKYRADLKDWQARHP